MRAAVIFGLDSSKKDLRPFSENSNAEWITGLPASSTDADAILIFGGDGTIHRHLPRLVQLQLPVLIVPCGSGNDFARALQLSSKQKSLSAWTSFCSGAGSVHCIDLGVIQPISDAHASTSHYFCCVGGVGLDGEVARRANRLPRWLRGHGGYLLSVTPALFSYEAVPIRLTVASPENPECILSRSQTPLVLAAFANTPAYGGGMRIAPHAQLDDGKLDVCMVHDIGKLKLFSLFPTVYFGRHLGIRGVEYMRTPRLRVETESPLNVYADGEYVCQTPVEVSAVRNGLRVIQS
jgi:diacylglycerol kinase (ATP)